MKDFTLDSTIGEIIGEPEGVPPSEKLLELIGKVIRKFAPECKWFIDRSFFNDRVDITVVSPYGTKGMSLLLNDDIGYHLHVVILRLTHKDEWHKGFSIGGITVNPYDWYPTVEQQTKFLSTHPEFIDKIFKEVGVLREVNEIREIVKRDYLSHTT